MKMMLACKTTPQASINVMIAVENRLVREALSRILQKDGTARVVSACDLAANTIMQIAEMKPCVLIFDPTGLESSCTQVILYAIKAVPGLKVVLIGMEADAVVFLRSVRAGIAGYLTKEASADDVVAAVHSVSQGKAVCAPELCCVLFEWLARQELPVSNLNGKLKLGLTRREMQVLKVVSCGCTNKEVAVQLNVSEQTVKNHVHRVLHKLGVANRLAATEILQMQTVSGTAMAGCS